MTVFPAQGTGQDTQQKANGHIDGKRGSTKHTQNSPHDTSSKEEEVDVGRHSDVGLDDGQGCRWKITRALGGMTRDHGYIKSQTSTEVVTEPGLTWAYFDRGKWRNAKIKV